jgi:hypothetical protein
MLHGRAGHLSAREKRDNNRGEKKADDSTGEGTTILYYTILLLLGYSASSLRPVSATSADAGRSPVDGDARGLGTLAGLPFPVLAPAGCSRSRSRRWRCRCCVRPLAWTTHRRAPRTVLPPIHDQGAVSPSLVSCICPTTLTTTTTFIFWPS